MNVPDPIQKQNSRNYIAHVFDGVLYMGGLSFTSAEIVLSVLIYSLGGSELAVGCVFALTELGVAAPQLLSAPFVERLESKKNYVLTCGFLQRIPWVILGFLLLFFPVQTDGSFVPVVLALIGMAFLVSGIGAPAWNDFVASTVPLRWRGRLFATRQGINGLIGIVAGFIVSYIINTYAFPINFAYLFFITYVFWMVSLSSLLFVRETAQVTDPAPSLYYYFVEQIPGILRRDGEYRWFLLLKAMMLMSLMSFGFFSVYGLQKFNLPASTAGLFTSLYMVGQILSSLLIGPMTDRYGHRLGIFVFAVIVLIQNLTAMLAPNLWIYCLIFPLLGANRILHLITFITMPMEYAETQVRPTYYAMSNTLLSLFYMSGMLGGWLIPSIGFHGIFWLSILFAFAVVGIVLWKITEPRHSRHLPTLNTPQ